MDTKHKMAKNLNKEFEEFFRDLENYQINCNDTAAAIFFQLNWHLRINFYKSVLKWIFGFILIVALVYYIPILNWNVSAIGRLVMLQLLQYWDWTYLYSADCLIPSLNLLKNVENTKTFDTSIINCDYCENIGTYIFLIL